VVTTPEGMINTGFLTSLYSVLNVLHSHCEFAVFQAHFATGDLLSYRVSQSASSLFLKISFLEKALSELFTRY
jgi:hypothetical protein